MYLHHLEVVEVVLDFHGDRLIANPFVLHSCSSGTWLKVYGSLALESA